MWYFSACDIVLYNCIVQDYLESNLVMVDWYNGHDEHHEKYFLFLANNT